MIPRRPLAELFLARSREFFREPEAIFWVYGFPILLAVGLGVAFRAKPQDSARICVEADGAVPSPAAAPPSAGSAEAVREALARDPRLRVEVLPPPECRRSLVLGRVDLVVTPGMDAVYTFDPQRPEGVLAREWTDRALQSARGRRDAFAAAEQTLSEPGSRYIDFLIPGIIGMNIMGGGLWGVGFVIVDMRVRKLLKRFLATPMRKGDFLLSIVGSRILFLAPEVTLLLFTGRYLFGVPLRGSVAAIAAIVLTSGLSFCGIGLLVASRAKKIETVSGLMNLVMLPMWLVSGIFFSSERFPAAVQPAIRALPLTATINALRSVMLEGSSLASQGSELLILAFWGVVGFWLSLRWFRWN